MSHRYPEKMKITGEGEESLVVPPHPLDSFFSGPEFTVEAPFIGDLSEVKKETLIQYLHGLVPIAMSFLIGELANQSLHSSIGDLQKDYGITRDEANLLMQVIMCEADWRVNHILETESTDELYSDHISAVLQEKKYAESSESPEDPQHE